MADKVLQLSIKGMFCRNCPVRIRRKLIYEEGIVNAEVSYEKMSARVLYDPGRISPTDMIRIIEDLGYQAELQGKNRTFPASRTAVLLSVIIAGYLLLQYTGLLICSRYCLGVQQHLSADATPEIGCQRCFIQRNDAVSGFIYLQKTNDTLFSIHLVQKRVSSIKNVCYTPA